MRYWAVTKYSLVRRQYSNTAELRLCGIFIGKYGDMDDIGGNYMNEQSFKVIFGSVVAGIAAYLGGVDGVLITLLAFMSVDYVTGVMAAGKRHELSSEVGFWGLAKKICILALVGVGNLIDCYVVAGNGTFRTVVSLYYIGNEGLSILENFGRLGVVYPKILQRALKQLRQENDKDDTGEGEGDDSKGDG